MRLIELNPRWVGSGGEGIYHKTGRPCPSCQSGVPLKDCKLCLGSGEEYGPAPERHGVGISFLCPCATCVSERTGDDDHDFHLRVFVGFENPLDGGPPIDPGPKWTRVGEDFDALILQPSILSVPGKGGCGWHGYVGGPGANQPGEVVTL